MQGQFEACGRSVVFNFRPEVRGSVQGASAIADYALIGDGSSAGLVGRKGEVAWLCWPSFNSAAIFASLLGDEGNGVWRIAPTQASTVVRRYRPETLILETRFDTEDGSVLLVDFMPYQNGPRAVVRRVRGLKGTVAMTTRFAPRFQCGSLAPNYKRGGDAALSASSDGLSLTLHTSRSGLARGDETVSFLLSEGETIDFVLTDAETAARDFRGYADESENRCEKFWRGWVSRCAYEGPWREAVIRSLITLKALIYAPTGGVIAAPTSSLPECMGGSRNWDYRYCWLRDSTFTVLALLHAGYLEEAGAWVNWLIGAIDPEKERTRIFYGVVPGEEIQEFEADWLGGFNGSRPVRLGNGARDQLQLGVYGEVQDTLHQWRVKSGKAENAGWMRQCAMLKRLATLVDEPDAGIWEQRGHLERFTHSRAMAWVAFDRALATAGQFGFAADPGWKPMLMDLHDQICANGYDSKLRSFTRAYGSESLDASCLMLAMVGFLPPDDPRIVGTVRAIGEHLKHGPFVYRYDTTRENDGVGGPEGAFLPCSFWFADNLILQKDYDAAASIFEGVLTAANDVGLLSEEYDVSGKILLGNFPQALTHLGLVNTALNLTGLGPAHSRSNVSHTRDGHG